MILEFVRLRDEIKQIRHLKVILFQYFEKKSTYITLKAEHIRL